MQREFRDQTLYEFPHFLTLRDPTQTIREKPKEYMTSRRRESGAVSRASLVHGSSHQGGDKWYDVDAFLLDQVREVLQKLSEGAIDDEIWGKIVIMERCKRVAKAYLRKTTVIVDGSEDEFDGKTLGFNYFENPERDEQIQEIRAKIGDGVILKMDLQGNIKGMARGAAPVICQGYRGERHSCLADRLIRQQGRLNGNNNEEEKAYKMFDMKKFKHILDRDVHDGIPDPRALLLKTCVRVALVKDGVEMSKTPCWFSIVNLVALDMLKEKVPNIATLVQAEFDRREEYQRNSAKTLGQSAISPEALTQLIAAAVTQAQKGSMPVSQEQIAHLASTLSLGPPSRQEPIVVRKDRGRKAYHSSTSSLDSSGEETRVTRLDSRPKKWDTKEIPPDDFYDSGFDKTKEREKKKPPRTMPTRPRLSDVVFHRSQSITSDYDSNKELFDSGSWSSTNSREFKAAKSKIVEATIHRDDSLKRTENPREDPLLENSTAILVGTPSPTPPLPPMMSTIATIYDEPFEQKILRAPTPPPPTYPPDEENDEALENANDDAGEVLLATKFSRGPARRWNRALNGKPPRIPSSTNSDKCCTSAAPCSVSPATTASQESPEAASRSMGHHNRPQDHEGSGDPTTSHCHSTCPEPSTTNHRCACHAQPPCRGRRGSLSSSAEPCDHAESGVMMGLSSDEEAVSV